MADLRQRKPSNQSKNGGDSSTTSDNAASPSQESLNQKQSSSSDTEVLVETLANQFQMTHDTTIRTFTYICVVVSISSILATAYVDQAVLHEYDLIRHWTNNDDGLAASVDLSEALSTYMQNPSRVWAMIHAAVAGPWLHFACLRVCRYKIASEDDQSKFAVTSLPFFIPLLVNLLVFCWGVLLMKRPGVNIAVDVLWRVTHLGLTIANVCTVFVAFLLRMDAHSAKELLSKTSASANSLQSTNIPQKSNQTKGQQVAAQKERTGLDAHDKKVK